MSATINHFISGLINPLCIGLIGIVLGLILNTEARRHGVRTAGKCFVWLSAIWLWVWSTGAMVYVTGGSLENEYPQIAAEELPEVDAIHILGGGMGINTNECLYAEMESGADRVWHGARIWTCHTNAVVICSGGCVRESTLPLLKDFGVPEDRVLLMDRAKNTEDEARLVGELMRRWRKEVEVDSGTNVLSRTRDSNYVPKVALVTSAWHMRRAMLLFLRSGLEVVPAACDYEVTTAMGRKHEWNVLDFVPNAGAISLNTCFFKEHFAYWCYRVKFWGK